MPSNRVVKVRSSGDSVTAQEMRDGIAAIQQEMKVSAAFPEAVERAATEAAADPRLPDLDRTDIELITIDPESARDLDQALHIERDPDAPGGYVVHYAIADVAAFVAPGDPVDVEANRRGETLYGADSKIPLHPPVLSEDAGSLLPDQVRPALLWTIKVDDTGEGTDVQVERALVRSRAKLSYDAVQADVDAGSESEVIGAAARGRRAPARTRGRARRRLAPAAGAGAGRDRGGSLGAGVPSPHAGGDLERPDLPAHRDGRGVADASTRGVGILRTLPPADPRDVQRLHRTARALGIAWPAEQLYPDFIRTLDPSGPTHAAMIVACTRLSARRRLRHLQRRAARAGAEHSALASEYAHVTAPLRRLVDRYAGEVCVALCAGTEVPEWVVAAMTELPDTMSESGRRANQYENAIVNLCEAELLHGRVGESFAAVVVEVDEKDPTRGDITIEEPAIEASVSAGRDLPLGEEVTVELVQADPASRSVEFRLA